MGVDHECVLQLDQDEIPGYDVWKCPVCDYACCVPRSWPKWAYDKALEGATLEASPQHKEMQP